MIHDALVCVSSDDGVYVIHDALVYVCLQMVVFVGWFCASAAMAPRIEIGLDQSLSMPKVTFSTR